MKRKKEKYHRGIASIIVLLVLIACICAGFILMRTLRRPRVIVQYQDIIVREAAAWQLEPAYVASVIMAESSYRPQIVSSQNAIGLMQLLPETALDVAEMLGEEYSEEKLFEPETNIRYGCRYLRWLMDTLHVSDMATTSAAYYQGPGKVRKQLADPAYSEDGMTLVRFGTPKTENYVNRILNFYKEYCKIYART